MAGLKTYLSYKLNALLVRTGEFMGWEWLVYNPITRAEFQLGAFKDAPIVTSAIIEEFPSARRAVDCGCGSGLYVRAFLDRGVDAIGCEYMPASRERARANGVRCEPFDVSKSVDPLPGAPFDLAMSIEVAEHIPEALADRFVDFMVNQSALVVLSAARPGQGGAGHINEQPKSYWIQKFGARGYSVDEPASESLVRRLKEKGATWFLLDNVMVLRRTGANAV